MSNTQAPRTASPATRAGILIHALVAVLVLTWGLSAMWRTGGQPAPLTQPTVAPSTEVPPAPNGVPARTKRARLFVPQVDIDAPVVPISLAADQVLDPPESVAEVGWWDGSAEAGQTVGQTVMTGHTVSSGGGVMDDLDELTEGDLVHVTDRVGRVDYVVTQVEVWSKQELADNAIDTFGQDRHHGRLVLVTCEDWVDGDYLSNVVVFADPITGDA